jgi:hypothetical protein
MNEMVGQNAEKARSAQRNDKILERLARVF